MLDICKYKVPTMETLYGLVDMLAEWKVNQLQLYAEHTFAYRSFPEVSHGFSPVTGEEVLALDAYCSERHVELVPNQNSFGHMERWLVHERMQHLAEVPDGAIDPWEKGRKEPFSLCPTDPESLEFLREIYTDLLPHFSSRQFNVGCDETWDVGMGRSKDRCEALGVGRVYLDFLEGIGSIVRSSGHTMQFWADVIQEHPDLIAELPADSVAMEWGYRRDHPFAERCARLAAHGVPTYVCPGTSTWNSVAGQTDEAVANIHRAAEEGLSEGAIGLLNTDWGGGMHGHWQYLPVSYLGMAWGAALSWSVAANAGLDMPRALDAHAFMDRAGVMGRLAFELGNAYRAPGVASRSGSVLGQILICFEPWRWARRSLSLSVEGLRQTLDYIDGVMNDLPAARMDRPDSDLIAMEFRNAAAMLRHACRLGLARLEADGELARAPEADRAELAEDMERIVAEHRRLWLARSRPGGLDASASRLSRWITVYVPSSAQSAPA
jgi:hypothetical protein